MKYETTVELNKDEVRRLNNLLLIESLGEMTDEELLEAGANTNDYVPLFCADFIDDIGFEFNSNTYIVNLKLI